MENTDSNNGLIRRGQRNLVEDQNQKAKLGEACNAPCDCEGYPDQNICCEQRAFGEKRCYKCWAQIGKTCSVNFDCCSQTCDRDRGVCVGFNSPYGQTIKRKAQPPRKVELCDILFSGDKLDPNPPLIPDPAKPYMYVMPSRTGPLKEIHFCPLYQTDRYDLGFFKLRGLCRNCLEWVDIQLGDMTRYKDGECFKIPIGAKDQMSPYHPDPNKVDYHMYHFVMYQKAGYIYPRGYQVGPHPEGELRFFSKCSTAIAWGKSIDTTYGLHPGTYLPPSPTAPSTNAPTAPPTNAPTNTPTISPMRLLGCYLDNGYDRDLTSFQGTASSNEECKHKCKSKGFRYMGRQWIDECFCGNDYGKYGEASTCGGGCEQTSGMYGAFTNCIYDLQ